MSASSFCSVAWTHGVVLARHDGFSSLLPDVLLRRQSLDLCSDIKLAVDSQVLA